MEHLASVPTILGLLPPGPAHNQKIIPFAPCGIGKTTSKRTSWFLGSKKTLPVAACSRLAIPKPKSGGRLRSGKVSLLEYALGN